LRLDFGSNVESEAVETKAKNVVMNPPTVNIVTKRVQGENTQSPAISTRQQSTEAGSVSPTTPTSRLFTSPPSSGSAAAAVAPSSPAPWAQDINALEERVNTSINEVKQEHVQLKSAVDSVRTTQQSDSNTLRLMSIRMGLMEPDPHNPLEMRAAKMAKSTPPERAPVPARDQEDDVEPMEHIEDKKRKTRETTPTVDTSWIILGPGAPPQHANTWVQFRVLIKEQSEDGSWLLQLVSPENSEIGNPFTTTKPALYKSLEEAHAALSPRLAGVRER
jgi:hypothetical protein